MRIIVDAFGGDNAPVEVLKGCALAVSELDVDILAVGDETTMRQVCKDRDIPLTRISLVHAPKVITPDMDATEVVKSYDDCSMAVGLKMLANQEGSAFVSAGSTGAVVVGTSIFVKRLRGIKRPALGVAIPCKDGCYLLVDIGANAECRPEMLTQFGIMGSVYMEQVIGVKNPRVGLVNIGTEESKGGDLQREAFGALSKAPIHFVGNVEPRELPSHVCDVAVCDGFTGNVILKLTEGLAKWFGGELKEVFSQNVKSKIGYLCVKEGFSSFKAKMDYKEYGGAPLIGATKPVIKAHGSSDAKAFKNAIRQAKICVEGQVTERVAAALAQMKEGTL